MTILQKLKKYMAPYYQLETDEELLNEYITVYTTAEKAAYALWSELPPLLLSGFVKSYDTGATQTMFQDMDKVEAMCRNRALYFEKLGRSNATNGSFVAPIAKEEIAGGATLDDELY